MRLKRLTVKGFKSFPDRTSLTFPLQGISAIVGPNGCGKSNILDAIRWVLGEQSPKMLRARSMEEVIYSGPNGRQVGYAEVSMVLEREGGTEGEKREIEVTRRLYRRGEAKYLIDGKLVRLKDILYLFMDTGTGTRAYALVDQGQVTRFVEMGPHERRLLIEEAAGISKYKQKRKETEARLKKTVDNMERLEDILEEVRREHRVVSKEAEVAQRFISLRERLDQYKKAHLGKHYGVLIEEERVVGLEKERLESRLNKIEADISQKRKDIGKLKEKIELLEDEYAGLQDEERSLYEEIERIERGLQKSRVELDRLSHTQRERQTKKIEIERRIRSLNQKKKGLLEELEEIKQDISRLKAEFTHNKALRDTVKEEFSEKKREEEAVKDKIVDAKSNLARIEGEEKSLLEREKDCIKRQTILAQKLDSLKEKEAGLSEDLDTKKSRQKELEREKEEIEAKIANYAEILTDLQEKREVTRTEYEKAASALRDTRHRLKAIEEIIQGGLDLFDHTRDVMRTLKGKGIPYLGLVIDFIEIKDGLEPVVEGVLGEDLIQAIVFERKDHAKEALKHLESKEIQGPIWFFVMDEDTPPPYDACPDNRCLLTAVKVPSGLRAPLVRRIGGLTELEGYGDCDRNRVYIHGENEFFLLGNGLKRGNRQKGLLERRSEYRRLKAKEGVETKVLAKLKEDLNGLSSECENLRERLDSLKEKSRSLLREQGILESEIKQLLRERTGLKDQREAIELEKEALSIDLEEIRRLKESNRKRRDAHASELSHLTEMLRGIQSELDQREDGLREFEERLGILKNELVRHETKRDSLLGHMRSIEASLKKLDQERAGLDKGQRSLAEKIDLLRAQLNQRTKRLEDLKGDLVRLRSAKDETYQALKDLREEEDDLSMALESIEADKNAILAEVHKMELRLSSLSERLSNIEEEAQELYSQTLESVWKEWAALKEGLKNKELEREMRRLKREMESMGAVNLGALERLKELDERLGFLQSQLEDLRGSYEDLKVAMNKIDSRCRTRLREALDGINRQLERVFPLLFEGGSAKLDLTKEGSDILEKGIEFMVKLPGKAVRSLHLLSGGEKALSALSLIFSIFFLKPAPFCVLDEVDAALDESNCVRFSRLLTEISKRSQVILITHNPRVMETAHRLFGVTMEEKGVSKLVSVRLE